jgi:Tol biopolymer transport system component
MGSKRVGIGGALLCVLLVPASVARTTPALTLAVSLGAAPPRFNSELWLVRRDGRGATRIIPTKRVGIADPAWAPSGRRVAFVVVRDPVSGNAGSVLVADVDGSHRHKLAAGFSPAWSPDGQTIAFSRSGTAGPAIWLMRPDGSHQRRLATGLDPAWAPGSKLLAFSRGGWIYVVNRNGGGLRQLTAAPTDCDMPDPEQGGTDSDPDWSPGGGTIAFVRDCDELSAGALDRIMTVRIDGTNLHPLTPGPDDVSPSWSPDGRSLAFVRNLALYTAHADGTHTRRLFAPRAHEVHQVAWLRRS